MRFKLLVLLLISCYAYADDASGLFGVSCSKDLSANFLINIFGDKLFTGLCKGDIISGSSKLGAIFRVFNLGLMVFAGGFITYAAVTTTLGKAQDGGQAAAGGGGGNPWMPVRLATGSSLLVPLASGYSFIQLLVMWAVMQGVGLADSIWKSQLDIKHDKFDYNQFSDQDFFLETLLPGKGGVTVSPMSTNDSMDTNNYLLHINKEAAFSVPSMYAVAVCLAVLEEKQNVSRITNPSIPKSNYGILYNEACGSKYKEYGNTVFCAGDTLSSVDEYKTACGVYEYGSPDLVVSNRVYRNINTLKNNVTNYIVTHLKPNVIKLLTQYNASSIPLSCNNSDSICRSMSAAYTYILNDFKNVVTVDTTSDTIRMVNLKDGSFKESKSNPAKVSKIKDDWVKYAKESGWITAGHSYYKLSEDNSPKCAEQGAKKCKTYDESLKSIAMPKAIKGFSLKTSDADDFLTTAMGGKVAKILRNFSATRQKRSEDINTRAYNLAKTKSIKDSQSVTSPNNSVQKGAVALKNAMYKALVTLPLGIYEGIEDNSSFTVSSNMHSEDGSKIYLTAPLDNLISLLGLVGGDLAGLNLRKNKWVTDYSSSYEFLSKKDYIGGCTNDTKTIQEACVKRGSGIIGYLYAYYDPKKDENPINPVKNITHIGRSLLDNSINYWVNTTQALYSITKSLVWRYSAVKAALSTVSGLMNLIPGIGGAALGGAVSAVGSIFDILWNLDMFNLTMYLPLGIAISGITFILGVMLGIYVPILPFMIYTFTAIGWLLAVVEAMIAAPLVALGVTHPQGHDLLGKAEQSVILLLGIFIRPSAIVLGLIAAISVLKQVMLLINTGFLSLMIDILDSSTLTGVNQIITENIKVFGVLIVYAYIVMSILSQVFSLVYQVPEKLLRWIGAAPEQSGVAQMVGEVKQGTQSAAQSLSQGGSSMTQKPQMDTVNSSDLGEGLGKGIRAARKEAKEEAKASKASTG